MRRLAATAARVRATLRTRAALGLGPATTPIMLLVPVGVLLGPSGTGVLPASAVVRLDVVISIGLATLGLFVGIAAGTQRGAVRRLASASTAEGAVTMLVVSAATFALLRAWSVPLELSAVLTAASLGIAAAASAAPALAEREYPALRMAARVADLDDVLPILAGGVLLSVTASGTGRLVADLLLTVGTGIAIGLGGWLLLERAEGAERGVFVIGTLALLGGAAAYLGTSPLVVGLTAGLFWALTPGRADQVAAADLRKVQHPLVVLLLITAGAGLEVSLIGIWLFAPYVLFRLAGKLLGGWVASRIAPQVAPSDLGAYLISPGVLGIAFSLNLQQVVAEPAAPIVFAVATGAVVSELLALIVAPARES
ncbi:MAG TPA: hypothetical protein VM364_05020 [Vicinamibacterales bacterium]|nr:hypothetical protein [Vicinamibacterales bacterium]